MKKILLLFLAFCFTKVQAQIDYSGIYSFSIPLDREIEGYSIKPTKDDGGPSGELILVKKSDLEYKFWLSANRGWPNYNNGFISGFISIKNGKANFKRKSEYADDYCEISFTLKPNMAVLTNPRAMGCDFGMGVSADGEYNKSTKVLTSEYLFSFMEGMGDIKIIKSAKAPLFKDAAMSMPSKQYFIKGDKVYVTDRSSKSVFVEYIAKGQRYIYGWISDEDI